MTSHADRTSPVVRGKWILENLIGTPPPPPPPRCRRSPRTTPGAPQTVRAQDGAAPREPGVRELSQGHGSARAGARELRRGRRVADAGRRCRQSTRRVSLPTARASTASWRCARRCSKRPEVLVGTMTEKLLTYALGRGLEHDDMPAVRAIVRGCGADRTTGSRRSCRAIVTSVPFQMRRAETTQGPTRDVHLDRRAMPRRTFLRGAGAALALPLLDAMVPALHRRCAHGAAPQRRARVRLHPARRHHGPVDAGDRRAPASSSRRS